MATAPSPNAPAAAQDHTARALLRYFQISLLCALAAAFSTLASTGKLETPAVVLFALALLVRLAGLAWRRDWRIGPRTVTALAIVYVIFFPIDFLYLAGGQTLVERILVATVHLVFFTAAIKMFSASSPRDHTYLGTLSFLMMLAAAILTVGAAYVAGLALYLLFAISTLISYEVIRPLSAGPAGGASGSASAEMATANAAEAALAKTAALLALAVVPVAALLFFLIPRYHSGYWSGAGFTGERITGFSERVDLGDIGKLLRSNRVIMRITVEGDPRRFQSEKLRGVALERFDGRRWSASLRPQRFLGPTLPQQFSLRFSPAAGRAVQYRVLLAPVDTDVLFVAGHARRIDAPIRTLLVDSGGALHNPQHVAAPFAYGVVADVELPAARDLRAAAGQDPEDVDQADLGLPRLDPLIATLARQITAGASNNYDRTVALERYLREHYAYTLDLPPVEPADPVASFLFRTKRGNCEYFAAALAVMLRTLGVPTRLVNGFQPGDYNRVGKDFIVRGRDAHSWVEVYFPEYGWVPFDATPAGPASAPGVLDDYLDAASLFWSDWVVNYDLGHQAQLAITVEAGYEQLDQRLRHLSRGLEGRGTGRLTNAAAWLSRHRLQALGLLVAILGLVTLTLRHPALPGWIEELRAALAWKLALGRGGVSAKAATLGYERFLQRCERSGFGKVATETPFEFVLRIPGASIRPPASALTELYLSARFGHRAVPRAAFEVSLRAALEAVASSRAR